MLIYDCTWRFWESDYPTVYHVYATFDYEYHLQSIVLCSHVALLPFLATPLVRKVANVFGYEVLEPLKDPNLWVYQGSTLSCNLKDIVMPKCELEDRYEILGFTEPIERGTLVDIFYELQGLRGKGVSQPLTVSAKRGDFIYKTGIQNLQEPIL